MFWLEERSCGLRARENDAILQVTGKTVTNGRDILEAMLGR
jgi:hypothetical protein